MRHRRSGILLLAAILGALAPVAQAQEAPAPPPARDTAGSSPVGSLTARYHLQERFTSREGPAAAGAIGQNQVAFRETRSADDPNAKGPSVLQIIYTERPAVVSPVDERSVSDSVRHFTSVQFSPDPWKGRTDRRPLEDLTVWYRTVVDEAPQVIVLTPGRPLRDEEYRLVINNDFVPNLAFLLPELPVRIGDSWQVERAGSTALVNDEIRDGILTARFAEVRAHPKDPGRQLAILDVTGRLVTGSDREVADTAVRARVQFAFAPEKQGEAAIEGSGFIEKLAVGQVATVAVPGLTTKKVSRRELTLERKVPGGEPLIPLPDPAPQATPENSWLTFADPRGRFYFRHPQTYQVTIPSNAPGSIALRRPRAGEDADMILWEYKERAETRPEASFKKLMEEWRGNGLGVIPGAMGRLPAADWPDLSVHHMEAVLTSPAAPGQPTLRRYFDAYVIQFPRNVSLFVSATTFQDQPARFREQVRQMLKTVKLGAPK